LLFSAKELFYLRHAVARDEMFGVQTLLFPCTGSSRLGRSSLPALFSLSVTPAFVIRASASCLQIHLRNSLFDAFPPTWPASFLVFSILSLEGRHAVLRVWLLSICAAPRGLSTFVTASAPSRAPPSSPQSAQYSPSWCLSCGMPDASGFS